MNRRAPGRSERRDGILRPLGRLFDRPGDRGTEVPRPIARAVEKVEELAGERARKAARQMMRPWREGRPGTAGESGRWLGLGLAVGAAVVGIVGGIYAATGGFQKND